MKFNKASIQKELKKLKVTNFLGLLVAGIVNAVGVTLFIAPVGLYDSGISGTSILLSQVTPEYLTLSIFLVLLNVPLFLIGLKRQGLAFTIYAVFTVLCYSLGAWLINDVLPIDVTMASPLAGKDLLLCSLFGGLISGIGSGMAIRFGGAMDGIEVLAVIFAKRLGVTVGTFVMVYNIVIYVIAGIIMRDWTLPLYSIVTYGAGIKTVDYIIEGIDRAKAAMIVTENPEEVCRALNKSFKCGITTYEAKGYYSDNKKTIVYIIINRFQISKMTSIVHDKDPKAYITISEVADVFSNNID